MAHLHSSVQTGLRYLAERYQKKKKIALTIMITIMIIMIYRVFNTRSRHISHLSYTTTLCDSYDYCLHFTNEEAEDLKS